MVLFVMKKIAASVLGIPGIFIAALLVSGLWQLRRRRYAGVFNLVLALIMYLCSLGAVADVFACIAESSAENPGAFIEKHQPLLYVVLGGGVVSGGRTQKSGPLPVPDMVCRLTDAVRLYRLHPAPVLVSGGSPWQYGPAEADVAAAYLRELGVAPEHILTERESRDTRENARFVAAMPQTKAGRVALVTTAWHLPRALFLFQQEGVVAAGFASNPLGEDWHWSIQKFLPEATQLRRNAVYLRELGALAVYKVLYLM